MDEYITNLNPEQTEAVRTTEGYVRVVAGAGSGKTRALTARFAYLVEEAGVMPGNILCVTFTNKAANEMRRRIHNLTGDNDTGFINTFHGFCVTVLREDIHAVGYPESFLVLDNSDIDAMLKTVYEERGLTLNDMTFSKARDMIEIQKGKIKPDYYLDLLEMSPEVLDEKYNAAEDIKDIIFYGYLRQEKKCFGLDYNDLIYFTLHIMEKNDEIREKWQQRLEYIMIDEFQDIDLPQYRLMKALCGLHRNLFIVGDPDQTIYTWRGAEIRFLMDFDKEFPGTKTVLMNRNYRSTPEIAAAANSLISKNEYRIKKELVSERPSGNRPVCAYFGSPEKEAEWMAGKIRQLQSEGTEARDITVLYRAHYITRVIEEVFLREKIPYRIYSGVSFFNRAEIKDALSYLRMLIYRDDLSFERIINTPKRNIGRRRMAILKEYAGANSVSLYTALVRNEDMPEFKGTGAGKFIRLIEETSKDYEDRPVSELLKELLDKSGYEKMLRTEGDNDRLDNLAELRQSVYEYESSCGEEAVLEHYLSHVAMFTNTDIEDGSNKVKLMTVHAAKGLEFKNVFLAAMNEGVFPSGKTSTRESMEEERRLAFVAVTRAEDRLFLSCSEGRNLDGSPRYPSRFILDISPELLDRENDPRDGLIKETRDYIKFSERKLGILKSNAAFKEGDRVTHDIFGSGTVEKINGDKGCYIISFDMLDTKREISFKARLKPEAR